MPKIPQKKGTNGSLGFLSRAYEHHSIVDAYASKFQMLNALPDTEFQLRLSVLTYQEA